MHHQATDNILSVFGAHYFVVRLPVGTYELVSMGAPPGGLAPKDAPFRFTVEKGSVKYIGAMVGDRDLKRHLDAIGKVRRPRQSDIISHKIYGVGTYRRDETGRKSFVAVRSYIDFFIIDESPEAISKFIEEFPEYRNARIEIDLMR